MLSAEVSLKLMWDMPRVGRELPSFSLIAGRKEWIFRVGRRLKHKERRNLWPRPMYLSVICLWGGGGGRGRGWCEVA